jgi:hypothetical protein
MGLSFTNSSLSPLAPWGGFQECVDLADCFANTIQDLPAPVSCSKLIGSPVKKNKYCRCIFGNGGTDCHILTTSALQRAITLMPLLLFGLVVVYYAFCELKARKLVSKPKSMYPIDVVVCLCFFGASFTVIGYFDQLWIVFGAAGREGLATWHWFVVLPIIAVLPMVTVIVIYLTWWDVLKRSIRMCAAAAGSAGGAAGLLEKLKGSFNCLSAKQTAIIWVSAILVVAFTCLALGEMQVYSIIGSLFYIVFIFVTNRIGNRFVGYMSSIGDAYGRDKTKHFLTIKQKVSKYLCCCGFGGKPSSSPVTPNQGDKAGGETTTGSTSVNTTANTQAHQANDLQTTILITIYATVDARNGMLVLTFGAVLFGAATLVIGRSSTATGIDVDVFGIFFLQSGYLLVYMACLRYAERVRTATIRQSSRRGWFSRGMRGSKSHEDSSAGAAGDRRTGDRRTGDVRRNAASENVEVSMVDSAVESSATAATAATTEARDMEVRAVDETTIVVES